MRGRNETVSKLVWRLCAAKTLLGPPQAASVTNIQINCTDQLSICYSFVMVETLPNTDAALASKLAAELRTTLGHLKRKLRQQGGRHDLTSSQIAVILRLEKDGPATVSSLARAEGMRPQSMSAVIAPLEEMGFVAGAADPNDGRKTLMSLTKACKKSIEDGRAARQDWLAQAIQQKLSPPEQKKVSSAIHLLARLTED